MRLVQDFLESAALQAPEKTALIFEGQSWTYAQIDQMANRLARGLAERGVARGDRVVLYLPNRQETVIGIFAVLKADAVFVVVNPSTKSEKLAHILNNCQAKALITLTSRSAIARKMLDEVRSLESAVLVDSDAEPRTEDQAGFTTLSDILANHSATPPPRMCIDQDLACLIYTSGSTGQPKGVMSAHENVVFAATAITTYLKNVADDVVICALPLSFDYGLYQPLMVFSVGATLVLERSFTYPAQFLRRLQDEKVTGLPGVPTIFSILLQMDLTRYDLRSLRYVTNTAAALPVAHIERLRRSFPQASLYSMYGLTETKRTLYLPPEQLDHRPGSVGIAIPGTEVWIEDDDGRRLGPGEVGELVVRGGHVMRGYWGDPSATAERFRAGPFPGERVCYSGDLFRMDQEGYLYFVARKDDIIKSRGEKVAPKEVENVLYAIGGVAEAAVVGVPDPILGEAIKAFVVSRDRALTEADVLRHCSAHLEDFMIPKYVVFAESLPKSDNGKIRKDALK
jgi:long-chain acyl-CoA synthetase